MKGVYTERAVFFEIPIQLIGNLLRYRQKARNCGVLEKFYYTSTANIAFNHVLNFGFGRTNACKNSRKLFYVLFIASFRASSFRRPKLARCVYEIKMCFQYVKFPFSAKGDNHAKLDDGIPRIPFRYFGRSDRART